MNRAVRLRIVDPLATTPRRGCPFPKPPKGVKPDASLPVWRYPHTRSDGRSQNGHVVACFKPAAASALAIGLDPHRRCDRLGTHRLRSRRSSTRTGFHTEGPLRSAVEPQRIHARPGRPPQFLGDLVRPLHQGAAPPPGLQDRYRNGASRSWRSAPTGPTAQRLSPLRRALATASPCPSCWTRDSRGRRPLQSAAHLPLTGACGQERPIRYAHQGYSPGDERRARKGDRDAPRGGNSQTEAPTAVRVNESFLLRLPEEGSGEGGVEEGYPRSSTSST